MNEPWLPSGFTSGFIVVSQAMNIHQAANEPTMPPKAPETMCLGPSGRSKDELSATSVNLKKTPDAQIPVRSSCNQLITAGVQGNVLNQDMSDCVEQD